jgi:hypothetical protein
MSINVQKHFMAISIMYRTWNSLWREIIYYHVLEIKLSGCGKLILDIVKGLIVGIKDGLGK